MQIDKNNWQIKVNKENKDIISRFLGHTYDIGDWYGLYDGKVYHDMYFPSINITIITTEQFRKYILGKEDSKFKGWGLSENNISNKVNKNIMQIDKNNWQIKVNEENREELEDYFIPKSSFLYFRLVINNWYGYIDGEMIAENDRTPYLKCIDIYQFRKYILGKEDSEIMSVENKDSSERVEYLVDKNNWQIKINEDNLLEIRQFVKNNKDIEYGSCGHYLICSNEHITISPCKTTRCYNIPIITTEQFRKYILGKEDRKIIGYKAPFDMGGGEIKKDDIFINDDWYIRESDGSFGFPKELVEAFFIPVYEKK